MRKAIASLATVFAMIVLTATPVLAATVTRSATIGHSFISCVITYTEMNDTSQIDTFPELRSITSVVCTVTRV